MFHSAASQASAAAASSTGKTPPTRQVATAAATSKRRGRELGGERGAGVSGQREVRLAADDRDRDRADGNERRRRQRLDAARRDRSRSSPSVISAPVGSSAVSRVPPPGRAVDGQRAAERLHAVGESAQARAARRVRPAAAVVGDPHDEPRAGRVDVDSRARDASAYLATLARPSEHTKYAAASCGAGKRSRGHVEDDRDAAWSASSPSADGRPCSVSERGCTPCANRARSARAASSSADEGGERRGRLALRVPGQLGQVA